MAQNEGPAGLAQENTVIGSEGAATYARPSLRELGPQRAESTDTFWQSQPQISRSYRVRDRNRSP